MKHCHCGLREHFHKFKVKKLGALGVVLFVGHILFHVAECLILPAIFVGFSGHLHEEPATALESNEQVVTNSDTEVSPFQFDIKQWDAKSTFDFRRSLELCHPIELATGS